MPSLAVIRKDVLDNVSVLRLHLNALLYASARKNVNNMIYKYERLSLNFPLLN